MPIYGTLYRTAPLEVLNVQFRNTGIDDSCGRVGFRRLRIQGSGIHEFQVRGDVGGRTSGLPVKKIIPGPDEGNEVLSVARPSAPLGTDDELRPSSTLRGGNEP
ncbi:hypothetical protein RHA1_ro11055 (plasmid) [Rhodococcus jostii RHA1]|uniref:Uncharacterized protein n=1 Tax=Rhodococcus jostii (strain RHA1) TaxID=101510 RepID=Q0RVI4_RHOJR|nr:hypothetical protein RHA1_ro11055 [Rhodococcus jostii RHA1]